MRFPKLFAVACAALASAAAPPAAAHHVWIEVADFTPEAGSRQAVELRVGDDFPGEPLARNAARIVRFSLLGGGEERPLAGIDGVRPFGVARFDAGSGAGDRAIVYRGSEARHVLAPDRFARYLEEEGLDAVAAVRAARGEVERPGREVYSRALKALVTVGGGRDPAPAGGSLHLEALGLDLELVPETRPAALRPGDELALRLLWRGEPLAGVRVVAVAAARPAAPLVAHAGPDGRVSFRLDAPGVWRLSAVHAVRLDGAESAAADADWRSVWTALTFVVPAPAETPSAAGGR